MLRTAGLLPPRGFRRWAKPSLLPGLLAATRTGLTPAGDDKLALDHELHLDLQLLGERYSQDTPEMCNSPLRTGERTRDRRLLRCLSSEGNSVICCEECESRRAQLRQIRFREQDAVLRRLPTARESLNQPRRARNPRPAGSAGAPIAARARLLPVSGGSWLDPTDAIPGS